MSRTKLDLNAFAFERDRLLDSLQGLADVANDLGITNLRDEILASREDLASDRFRVAVVGEFSRGKSTFINALIGTKILPSSVSPTTTVLTEITHSDEVSYVIRYRGANEEIQISAEEFISLIAPMEPSSSDLEERRDYDQRLLELRRIEAVTIFHPLQTAHSGIQILDTPGTNDLDPMREQITFDIIPRSDAVVFMLSARQALSETEMDFLRNRVLKTDVHKVFFILNHADRLDDEELSSVYGDTVSRVAAVVPTARVYPISARNALRARAQDVRDLPWESQFANFEMDLADFLLNERMEAKLERPRSHGRRLCEEMRLGPLAVRKASLGSDLPSLKAALERGRIQLEVASSAHSSEMTRLRVRLEHGKIDILPRLRAGLHAIANAACNALAQYEGEMGSEDLQRHIETAVAASQQILHTQSREWIEAAVRNSLDASEVRIDDALRLATDGMRALGVTQPVRLRSTPGAVSFSDENKFWITAGAAGLGLALLPFAAPIALAAGIFGGRALSNLLEANGREQAMNEVRSLLEERYRASIPDTLSRFESSWDTMSQTLVNSTESSFQGRLTDLRKTYELAANRLRIANADLAKEKIWLQSLESRISEVSMKLERSN